MVDVLFLMRKIFLFLLLFSFVIYSSRCKANKSVMITLSIVLIAELFMYSIESWIWKIENLDLLRFAWFNTFAWCDIAVVYCIGKQHKKDYQAFSFAARSAIYSYLLLGTIQLIAYFDRSVLETQLIAEFCQLLIPTISISITLILLSTVCRDVFFSYREKRGKAHVS